MSIARLMGKNQPRQAFLPDSRWILPTCLVGVEFEYEGVMDRRLPKHTFADFWKYHEEGSLRDNGAEYVFSDPLFGIDIHNALEWLTQYAAEQKWKSSKRTGIHVHVDVRDLAAKQLAGMCILYAALEPLLYEWIGDARSVSHFCLPLYTAEESLRHAASILSAALKEDDSENPITASNLSQAFERYAGFNLQALSKFGSIEFRHMQTTNDLQRIETWINMLMSLKAAAFKLPSSDGAVVRMIERMGVYELLHYVFSEDLARQLTTANSRILFHKYGLPCARDLAVQGCNEKRWAKSSFPKGEHSGFSNWVKNQAAPSQAPLRSKKTSANFERIMMGVGQVQAPAADAARRQLRRPPRAER